MVKAAVLEALPVHLAGRRRRVWRSFGDPPRRTAARPGLRLGGDSAAGVPTRRRHLVQPLGYLLGQPRNVLLRRWRILLIQVAFCQQAWGRRQLRSLGSQPGEQRQLLARKEAQI